MKLNISDPVSGNQKCIVIDDEVKIRAFFDLRMGHEIDADFLGEEFKGYVLRITGGNDKQGFPMKQGVLVNGRVRLLMAKGMSCYKPRRKGERVRKSIRGCIIGHDISVLALKIAKHGPNDIAGLTDNKKPIRLGPKRANKIRKLFDLSKEDDVRKYVVRREIKRGEAGKSHSKAPKIQRLITDVRIRRKKMLKKYKKERMEASKVAKEDFKKVLDEILAKKKGEKIKAKKSE